MKHEGLFPSLSNSDRNTIRSEYPVPIATMFMKVQKGRNDEAAAFDLMRQLQGLFEVVLKLFAAIVVSRYRLDNLLVGLTDKAVEAELRKFSGTVGDGLWKELLRNVLVLYDHKKLENSKIPGLTEIKQLLANRMFQEGDDVFRARKEILSFIKTYPGFDQKIDAQERRADGPVNFMTILADLKDLRNVSSHVAGLHPMEYVKQNRTLGLVLGTLLKEATFLKSYQLGTVKRVLARSASDYEAIVSMSKGTEVESDPELPVSTKEFLQPGHTYLWLEVNGTYKPLLNLHPFVILEYCTQDQSHQYFFFNGSPSEPSAYASYRCGHQLAFPGHADDLSVFRDLDRWKSESWIQLTGVVAPGSKEDRFRQLAKESLQTLPRIDDESSAPGQALQRATELGKALARSREKLVIVAEAMQIPVPEGERLVDDLLFRYRVEHFSRLVKNAASFPDQEREAVAAELRSVAEALDIQPDVAAGLLDKHLNAAPPRATPKNNPGAPKEPSVEAPSEAPPPAKEDAPSVETVDVAARVEVPPAASVPETPSAAPTSAPVEESSGPARTATVVDVPTSPRAPTRAADDLREDAAFVHFDQRAEVKRLVGVAGVGDLVVSLADGRVARWVDGKLVAYASAPGRMKVFAGQGATRIWVGGWDEELVALEPSGVAWRHRLVGAVSALGPSPVGGICLVGTWAGDMHLFSADGRCEWSQRGVEGVHALHVDGQGERVLRADLAGTVSMHDTSGNIIWGHSLDGLLCHVSWAADKGVALSSGSAVHLVSEAGLTEAVYETGSPIVACWPGNGRNAHVVASSDGHVVLVEPIRRGGVTELKIVPLLATGGLLACASVRAGRFAWVNETQGVLTVHVENEGQPPRAVPVPEARGLKSLVWPERSAWLWLIDGEGRLFGLLDRSALSDLASASLELQGEAPSMAVSRYDQLRVKLRNSGERRARQIALSVEGEFASHGLPLEVGDLAGGATMECAVSVRPMVEGHVPVTLVARYDDELSGAAERRRLLHVEVQAASKSGER